MKTFFLSILCLFVGVFSLKSQNLTGYYTLNSKSPTADSTKNFQSFADLQQALSSGTVTGPVVINVRSGTYREHFALGNITGVSSTNTVTIAGSGLFFTFLIHDGTISNATVSFDGTSYVNLVDMTIKNTKDSTRAKAWGIHLQNTDHISISSCLIDLPASKTFDRIGIVGSGSLGSSDISTTNNHLSIAKNMITGGYCGVSLNGNTGNADLNNDIQDNLMFTFAKSAIIARNQDNLIISQNVIKVVYDNISYGIYCQNIRDFEIAGNELSNCGDDGIIIDGGTSSRTPHSLIANNMIHANRGKAIRMIANNTPLSKVNIYHNTAVGKQAIGFFGFGAYSNMNLYNNIFSASKVPFYVSSSLPSTVNIDYNLYHHIGAGARRTIAKVGTRRYHSLAAWQTRRPALNAHSVEGDPVFVDSTTFSPNLHLLGTLAHDKGKNSLGITFDIDYDFRPQPPSKVDIGADEYDLPTSLSSTCPSSTDLSVVNVDATTVKVAWISTESPGQLIHQQTIRYRPQDFTVGHEIFININNPIIPIGGSLRQTLQILNLIPSTSYELYIQDSCSVDGVGDVSIWSGPLTFKTFSTDTISGTFTLGGTSGPNNFPDFDSLATALIDYGISGPVTINVAPGTYREQFSLGSVSGVSDTSTIVIDGGNSSQVILTTKRKATVRLRDVSYVTLRNMTIKNAKWGIHLRNTNYITIDSCLISLPVNKKSNRGGIVGSGLLASSSISTTNNYLTISNNTILGGYYGVSLKGNPSIKDVGNRILNNDFIDIYSRGIAVDGQRKPIISDNVMIETVNGSSNYGIYCKDITKFKITANKLLGCKQGIIIAGSPPSVGYSLIANNMIYAPGNGAIRMMAYFTTPISKINIYHNTLLGGNYTLALFGGNYSDINLYNNIFSSTHGPAFYALLDLPTVNIDYNVYHDKAPVGTRAIIAKVGSAKYLSLFAWQTASPALNVNSIRINIPLFISIMAPVDLHIDTIKSGSQTANDIGKSGLNIDDDIDGDPRPLPPSTKVDIGADEYTLFSSINEFSRYKTASGTQSSDTLSWTTGGGEPFNERSLRIYPNPSDGVFNLEFTALGEDIEVRIINMLGQVILEDELKSFGGSYRKRLDMTTHRSGIYLLQLITERTTVNRRITLE